MAEYPQLNPVLNELFDAHGCFIRLRPMHLYVNPNYPVNFYTVARAAQDRGEVAVGYRLSKLQQDRTQNRGISLNPARSVRVTFSKDDLIIVLANS